MGRAVSPGTILIGGICYYCLANPGDRLIEEPIWNLMEPRGLDPTKAPPKDLGNPELEKRARKGHTPSPVS